MIEQNTEMTCKFCDSACVKFGFQATGKQKIKCKVCRKYQQESYSYQACTRSVWDLFPKFSDLGVGVNKSAKFLDISVNTFQKWVLRAECLYSLYEFEPAGIYDMDEIQTYVKNRQNKIWIAYAIHVGNREVVSFHAGSRSSEDLNKVMTKVLDKNPRKINTDNWVSYPRIVPKKLHKSGKKKANHIERNHVNLRKDIAYLIRETICFAKNIRFLHARLCWYFWSKNNPYFFLKN